MHEKRLIKKLTFQGAQSEAFNNFITSALCCHVVVGEVQ